MNGLQRAFWQATVAGPQLHRWNTNVDQGRSIGDFGKTWTKALAAAGLPAGMRGPRFDANVQVFAPIRTHTPASMSGDAMAKFLKLKQVQRRTLKSFLLTQAERIKQHALSMAAAACRPHQYLSGPTCKEDRARQIAERDGQRIYPLPGFRKGRVS